MKITVLTKSKGRFEKYLKSLEMEFLKERKSITSSYKKSGEYYDIFEWEIDTHNKASDQRLVSEIKKFVEQDRKLKVIVE
jgi:hypothetical protein